MWMTEYICAVKRALRDQHNCKQIGGTEYDPAVDAKDGDYPCLIDGKLDRVVIKEQRISCCNLCYVETPE